jgi:23S rRNA pseudouridine1911/1915/1917 synthase
LIAKTDAAHEQLKEQFETKKVTKKYWAVCCGVPSAEKLMVKEPLERHPNNKNKMIVSPTGKEAISEIKLLKTFMIEKYPFSVVEVQIFTGRYVVKKYLMDKNTPNQSSYATYWLPLIGRHNLLDKR